MVSKQADEMEKGKQIHKFHTAQQRRNRGKVRGVELRLINATRPFLSSYYYYYYYYYLPCVPSATEIL